LGPSQKTLCPAWCPKLVTGLAEAMLRLFIAEQCSTQLYKNMQPFERDRQELCHTKKRVSCSYVAQNVDWNKMVGRKEWWSRSASSAHAHWERVQDEKL